MGFWTLSLGEELTAFARPTVHYGPDASAPAWQHTVKDLWTDEPAAVATCRDCASGPTIWFYCRLTPVRRTREVRYNPLMPSYPHIEQYRAKLQELIEFGGSDNEENIRPAFQNCLDSYCRDHRERLVLIPELKASPGNKPDGTVKDSLRMARGYWEAKDSHDDLDAEIQAKFNRGYPRDNIIFEDSQIAVLVQNASEAMRVNMSRGEDLHRLIRIFLDYELPEIQEFRYAQNQFKTDLPTVLENLRATVAVAEADNPGYQEAAASFLDLCRKTIGPAVSPADVREMLLQHILTKDIFLSIFKEDQFHQENNVARQLDTLERTFFTGDVRREAIERLRAYYGVIGRAADDIADYAEKQQFLKGIYEDFYTAYNPAAADRLGVVYTPNEVVDFIIRGADHLLQKHFGKTLADDNVQILDPATGTGTFVTNLINHLPADRLEHKYRHEIHANEVAILPYYIANLNIEYTYQQRTGRYLEFPNLCFVDTLDNLDGQQQGATGGAVIRQGSFNLGGLSEENWIRIQEQNEKPISVIIGNPPYNDSAKIWGDDSDNRAYSEIDKRIQETYVKEGTAQRSAGSFNCWAVVRLGLVSPKVSSRSGAGPPLCFSLRPAAISLLPGSAAPPAVAAPTPFAPGFDPRQRPRPAPSAAGSQSPSVPAIYSATGQHPPAPASGW